MDIWTDLNSRLAQRAVGLRREFDMTVADLCTRSGLTPNMICKIERGNRNFRSHTLGVVANAFQVDPQYFVTQDAYVAQAMRDPVFAAQVSQLAREYFTPKPQETPAA